VLLLLTMGCQEYDVTKQVDVGDPGDTDACADTGSPYGVATEADCRVEPVVGTFAPVVEWQWTSNPAFTDYDDIMSTPVAANLTDDDDDGDIDADDIPDVVFTSFAGGAYTSGGTLTAISGDGSGTHWSLLDVGGLHVYSSGAPAIGDLDADGVPEVCTAGVEAAVVCVGADGAFRWAAGPEPYPYGAPALADLDGDGRAEVIFGRTVLDASGAVRWSGTAGAGYWLSYAVDLDGDGALEVVAGNTAYRADGTTLWISPVNDGITAVGDFDADGAPEVVHVQGGTVSLLSGADGSVRWQTPIPGGGHGGAPTVADFDNDGAPEVGVAGATAYAVFDTDGALLWQQPVVDASSNVTGSSVFDFEGDGASDVVYSDELTLWVYDGATGAVKLQLDDHASGTLYEYPLVLDVDRDGATEIVLASNDYGYDGWNGITVIGDASGSWRPSRPVWNQFAYSVTNVEDDGGIPAAQAPNWERFNTFRAGGTTYGLGSELPDLRVGSVEVCDLDCDAGTVGVRVPVENTGLADAPAAVVALVSGGAHVAEASVAVPAGQATWAGPFVLDRAAWGSGVRARADVDAQIEECDEDDNVADLGAWPCAE
jgi:hypothetical protein